MNTSTIDQELKFLSTQFGIDTLPEIQKLSPAQMAALANALGRKHGIKIEFGHYDTAATNGKTIALPITSKENSWLVRGYLDHELAHVRLTDFSLVPANAPFRKSLWNVLEDIRIEATMPMHYPGMATNYRTLIRELCRTSPEMLTVSKTSAPESIIIGYILLMLRSLYLRQAELAENARKARKIFIKSFGKVLEGELFPVIMKISNVKCPQDVLDLVDRILALLEQHAAELQQSKDDAGTDAPDDPSGNGPETPSGSPGDAQAAPGNTDTDNPGEVSTADTDAAQPGVPSSARSAIKAALESSMEISDLGDQLRMIAEYREYQTGSLSGQYDIASPVPPGMLRKKGYEVQAVNASSHMVAELSSRLRGLLQAHNLQNAKPGMAGSRINRNRLHRIKTGNPKLFLKKTPQKMVNTTIHLLVDNSSSMNTNYRLITTRSVVLALAKTLGAVRGVNMGITVFPAYYPYPQRNDKSIVPVAPILPHGQTLPDKILYPAEASGMTPLASALRWAASEMLNCSEPRRIIMIITDGEPDCSVRAGAAIEEAMALGIEVVCLGIEDIAYPDIFPSFEIVNGIQELPEKTFMLLEKLLIHK